MRYPAAETAARHERILDAASRLFRERGFDGVGLGEIMKATGLTHGPFYNHFASKDALMAESVEHAAAIALERMDVAASRPDGLRSWLEGYLSRSHRDDAGQGCLVAALGSEGARQPGVRAALTAYCKASIERLVRYIPWRAQDDARRESIRLYASLVGGVVLARAVDDATLADEILASVLAGLGPD